MGDQLAKGWADSKARNPLSEKTWTYSFDADGHQFYELTALGAPSLNPIEAEVQAEEDLLP